MRALVSDIHGNLEALTAVRADIDTQNVSQVLCLGDIVGYGPNPCECVDLAMKLDVAILGDHEQGVLDQGGFAPGATRSLTWTRAQLSKAVDLQAEARWEFLRKLPRVHADGDYLFVHGSPRNLNEYIFPEDVYNPLKIASIFPLVDRYCFQGHTHVPGIFTENLNFFSPADVNYRYELDGTKTLVNIGSVGQPRDGDNRACYVLLDGTTVIFRRIDYDFETTVKKIRDLDFH